MTRPPNSFVGEVMHDSDQFSVNLTDIRGRNAVRLYELLIQGPPMFSRGGRRFLELQASLVVFQMAVQPPVLFLNHNALPFEARGLQ
jgi:hypothetical protein